MQPHFGPTSKTKKPYSWDSKQKPLKSGFIWNLNFTILNKTHNFEVGQQNSRLVLFSFYVYKNLDRFTQGYKMERLFPIRPPSLLLPCLSSGRLVGHKVWLRSPLPKVSMLLKRSPSWLFHHGSECTFAWLSQSWRKHLQSAQTSMHNFAEKSGSEKCRLSWHLSVKRNCN